VTRTLLRVSFTLLAVALVAMVAFSFLLWPTPMEESLVVVHWGTVPDKEKDRVIADKEGERDVYQATFDQRGRDISLGLMVMHPMDLERAEHLAGMFADRANEVAQPHAEVQVGEDSIRPDVLPAYRYSVRLFSLNEVFTVGETPKPEEFTILEWSR